MENNLFLTFKQDFLLGVEVGIMFCGTISAIYFSEMDKIGNDGPTNKVGAAYGIC